MRNLFDRYRRWRLERLKKKLIIKILSSPNHKPSYYDTITLVDRLILYIYNPDDHGDIILS